MLTIKCSLKFPDGVEVSGWIVNAVYPEQRYKVYYDGQIERLPEMFDNCDPGFLEYMFRNFATETGATLTVTKDGEYDSWAE